MCQDPFRITQLEMIKGHRKEMPPPSRAYRDKKRNHERRDKSWKREAMEVIAERSYA